MFPIRRVTPWSPSTLLAVLVCGLFAWEAPGQEPVGDSVLALELLDLNLGTRLTIDLEARSDEAAFERRNSDRPELRLRGRTVDLTLPNFEAALPASWRSGAENRLWILQWQSHERAGDRLRVRSAGLELLDYFPDQARLVLGSEAAVRDLAASARVRGVTPYHPGWRLPRAELQRAMLAPSAPRLQGVPKDAANLSKLRAWHVMATTRGEEARRRILARNPGLVLHRPLAPSGSLMVVQADAKALRALVHDNELFFVEPWGPTEADVDQARILVGADSIELAAGYAGHGVRGQVRDFGLELNHPEWAANPPLVHVGNSPIGLGHGTAVYGIVFSPGQTTAQGRGLLPEGEGVFQAESLTVDRYAETAQLLTDPFRCVFETNSTGSPVTPDYTVVSAAMDEIAFDLDFLILQSQSNTGTQDSRPEAWAKNILSVGGVRHDNTASPLDDSWGGIASIGPAADGRIKPDLCSFADLVFAPSPFIGYLQGFGGTSAATPIVAGAAGLFHEMWADGIFGNALVNWDVFDNRPSMTLAKAMLLNSAQPYPFVGFADDLTRTHQGWGQPDLAQLLNDADSMQCVDEEIVLAPLAIHQRSVTVPPATDSLRITLCFADPPGNPAAAQHRVNDLDLEVVSPQGLLYRGNVGLLNGNISTPGGLANAVDTVERVVVPTPPAGAWVVRVIAREINEDGHVETPGFDADFSLVIAGVLPEAPPTPDSGESNRSDAAMELVDAVNLNGRRPRAAEPGPFFVTRSAGETLDFRFQSAPGRSFLLLLGALNRGNVDFGAAGQLDIGQQGPGLADLSVVLNGAFPETFLDLAARVGPTGAQSLSFTIPVLPPGVLGAFQAVFYDPAGPLVQLSAATQVELD